MSLPSARGWGPGWPNPETDKIVKPDLPGFGNAQSGRQEIITIFEWLVRESERRGYDIRPEWTWGFSNRPVRGTEDDEEPVPSDHSWGTAWDINAPVNGMNYAGRGWKAQHAAGKTDMPEWLPELWKAYGFEWGGDFGKRQDPMHMQFGGTPADAARYTAKINKPEDDMYTDEDRKRDEEVARNVASIKRGVDSLVKDYGTKGKGVRQVIVEIDQKTDDLVTGARPEKG